MVNELKDVMGEVAIGAIKNLEDGEALLLENVRTIPEETLKWTPEKHSRSLFVRKLSPLVDYFISGKSLPGIEVLKRREVSSLIRVARSEERAAVLATPLS